MTTRKVDTINNHLRRKTPAGDIKYCTQYLCSGKAQADTHLPVYDRDLPTGNLVYAFQSPFSLIDQACHILHGLICSFYVAIITGKCKHISRITYTINMMQSQTMKMMQPQCLQYQPTLSTHPSTQVLKIEELLLYLKKGFPLFQTPHSSLYNSVLLYCQVCLGANYQIGGRRQKRLINELQHCLY